MALLLWHHLYMAATASMIAANNDITQMNEQELRIFTQRILQELRHKEVQLEKLAFENATLKRLKFAAKSEKFNTEQRSLLEDTLEEDLKAVQVELAALQVADEQAEVSAAKNNDDNKDKPRRQPLPANLPRTEFRHEPESTVCRCGCALKRIGEDIAEKLDYTPGVFTVERHIRGKWACVACETLTQAPVPAHVIDKGIPTAGLLAHVLIAKYADHLPLYRQEQIFGRAGLALPRSTMAAWVGACGVQLQPLVDALKAAMFDHSVLHADETPVQVLDPGAGKTKRAYLWTYASTTLSSLKAVVYDFADGRAGEHTQTFFGDWRGTVVCDGYSGYKALLKQPGMIEAGCLAHARRKFYDLWIAHKNPLAESALHYFTALYEVEREASELSVDERYQLRQIKAKPIADALHGWLIAHRQKVPDGGTTAKAMDYSLKRWSALVHYINTGNVPADNNWVENQIRPIAIGRSNWLFAGSLRAGQRAAAAMSLIQSAKINGLDPYAYLKDVLERLPTQPNSRIEELLPHCWKPTQL
jgi:transposase